MRLIDGDALKEKLQEQQKYGSTADSRGRAKAIVEVIHAPTIEAEPVKHGRWIIHDETPSKWRVEEHIGLQILRCTKCNGTINTNTYAEYYQHQFRFCPFCGKEMRG